MVKKLHHTLSKISYYRTKNVPWHILAPAAVACDIYIVRRSAHPRGAFLCNRNEVSYYIKKLPYKSVVSSSTQSYITNPIIL